MMLTKPGDYKDSHDLVSSITMSEDGYELAIKDLAYDLTYAFLVMAELFSRDDMDFDNIIWRADIKNHIDMTISIIESNNYD